MQAQLPTTKVVRGPGESRTLYLPFNSVNPAGTSSKTTHIRPLFHQPSGALTGFDLDFLPIIKALAVTPRLNRGEATRTSKPLERIPVDPADVLKPR